MFSEDMAHKTRQAELKRKRMSRSLDVEDEENYQNEDKDLKTVDDLAKSILSYGSHVSFCLQLYIYLILFLFS